ncbi:hypothetical protein P5F04_05145 [Clostridium perfringens]|nr:hypothetical protein [Clostridium perfringens]MDK0664140.1 hypothetical protein [Clostridium perfringens]
MLDYKCQEIDGNGNNQAGRDINIYSNRNISSYQLLENVPNTNEEYIERNYTNTILNYLKDKNIIQIYGISGIGKTELVKSVISKIKKDKKIYWISCDDTNEKVDLSCINNIYGKHINLLDKINKEKAIIVLDNYNAKLTNIRDEFNRINTNDSKLIVTSKAKTTCKHIFTLLIDYMSYDEAKMIFDDEMLKSEELNNFLKKIDKHPMTLQILKNYLNPENGITFNDIKNRINDIVNMDDGEITSSIKICEKIIGLSYNENPKVYKFLSLCDSNILETDFLKKIMLAEIPNLISKNFIKYEDKFYYMHSIIKDSINAIVNRDGLQIIELKEYTDKVLKYLEEKIELKDLCFYRFYGYNTNLLDKLYSMIDDNYFKVVLYNAYIVANNYHNKETVISDIDNLLKDSKIDRYYELKLLVEKYELEIACANKKDKKDVIVGKIKQLKEIEYAKKEDKYKDFLQQRIGKFYNWSGNYSKAVPILEDRVSKDKKGYSSILQLCRAYRQLALDKHNNQHEYIMKAYNILKTVNFSNMPISIFLEIIKLIISRPFNTEDILDLCLWNNFELFDKCVELYCENKIHEHIYIIIGDLASNLYYNKSDYYKKWFIDIEHPKLESCDKRMLSSMINIYCYEIKRRVQADENAEDILPVVKRYWNAYKEKYAPVSEFKYKAMIDCLISMKEFDEAEIELNEVYRDTDIWHLRYKAQIAEGRKDYDKALEYIDIVIDRYEKTKNQHKGYLNTFLKDRERISAEKSN